MNDALQLEEAQAEVLMGQIVDEFLERKDRGEQPDLEDYARRYPELAVVIRQMLPALGLMQWSAGEIAMPAAGASHEITPEGPLGDFRLVREVGRGGMGVVYEAVQISLGRRVALKVLPFAAALDAKQLQRFKHEAQAAAALHHQNIVPVYGVGCERGVHYYAMQFIDGQTLAAMIADLRRLAGPPALEATRNADSVAGSLAGDMISGAWLSKPHAVEPLAPESGPLHINGKDRPLPDTLQQVQAAASTENSTRSPAFFRTVAQLGIQASEALEHSHSLGVVHRDIKPTNLLVDARGGLWITDFGLAHIQSDTKLTMTGDILGTLRYMSPEQALAQRVIVDHRTDIYSLGATLYELLTLEPVFAGADRHELLRQIAFEEPRRPRQVNKAVPHELETIVLKALEKNPAERYGNAQELADDLARFLKDEPIRARRPSLLGRARKWARRHRSVVASAIIATAAVVAVAIVALLVSLGNISAALKREKETTYLQRIALAERALAVGNVSQAEELLDSCEEHLRGWEWRLLKRQRYESPLFIPHSETVVRVAFSHDGRQIVSARMGGALAVWDARTGRPLPPLEQPAGRGAPSIAYSRDGRYLAVARKDGHIHVWDPTRGKLLHTLEGHQGICWKVAFSPDSCTLASGGEDRSVRLWDMASGKALGEFREHPEAVKAVAFRPGGQSVVAACDDGTVNVWDLRAERKTFSFQGDLGAHPSGAWFSPDARRLAWSCRGGVIKIWNTNTGALEINQQSDTHGCRAVAFSPDGRRIALAGFDGNLRLLDASTGTEMLTIFAHRSMVGDVTFSPDGQRLASASYDNTLRISDATPLTSDTLLPDCVTLLEQKQPMNGVAVSSDGRWLAAANGDGSVPIWEIVGGAITPRYTVRGHRESVVGVAFSSESRILVSGSLDNTVKLWDLHAPHGNSLPEIRSITCRARVTSVALSRNGRFLAVGQQNGIALYDPATGNEVAPFKPTPSPVPAVTFSPDSRWLISAGASDPAIKIWKVDDEKPKEIRHHSNPNASVAISFDGKLIASPARDRAAGVPAVKVWDAQTHETLHTLRGHLGYVWKVTFSADGRYLASGSWDSTIKIWDLKAPEAEPVTLRGHAGIIHGLAFSPDGQRLASASGSARYGEVKIWDAKLWK